MKRIIRKRVVLVLLLSLCLSLTACGNGNSGDSGNDTGVTPTRIEGMLKKKHTIIQIIPAILAFGMVLSTRESLNRN